MSAHPNASSVHHFLQGPTVHFEEPSGHSRVLFEDTSSYGDLLVLNLWGYGAQSLVTAIPQQAYSNGLIAGRRLLTNTPIECNIGCRVEDAIVGHMSSVEGHGNIAFPAVKMGQKMTFRYQFEGYPRYNRQVNVLCKGEQPTKARLANLAARELQRFINGCAVMPAFSKQLDKLVILKICLVSDGSLQPFIGVEEDLSPDEFTMSGLDMWLATDLNEPFPSPSS